MKILTGSHPLVAGRTEFNRAAPWMRKLASRLPPGEAVVEVTLVGRGRMAFLNRAYRGRRGAAEILTFSYAGEDINSGGPDDPRGEIFLCWPALVDGARRRGVSNRAYLLRLLAHGLCHIRGFTHGSAEEERIMEKEEEKLLSPFLPGMQIGKLFA
ncbi:MAG: rRNA maturation RNase YbeY [Candidatus Krumholzibacteriota bacterium]|nr:rRNA maturation RNase YbeY [Candidatus Krumholzibacteriota bacterium]